MAETYSSEICITAAILLPDGTAFRCHRHNDGMQLVIATRIVRYVTQEMQGFVTSRNRFVNRKEGMRLMKQAQPARFEEHSDTLFSEDLY